MGTLAVGAIATALTSSYLGLAAVMIAILAVVTVLRAAPTEVASYASELQENCARMQGHSLCGESAPTLTLGG